MTLFGSNNPIPVVKPDSTPKTGHPFHEFGFQHGLEGTDKEVGERALAAEATGKWQESEAERASLEEIVSSLSERKADEEECLLPSLGRHRVTKLRKFEIRLLYPMIWALACVAEICLAAVRIAQSNTLGSDYKPPLALLNLCAFYALVSAIPLLGFSIETLWAALRDSRNWQQRAFEALFPFITVVLFVCFVITYSKLSGAISQQGAATKNYQDQASWQRALRNTGNLAATQPGNSGQAPNHSGELADAGARASDADALVHILSGPTFEFLTAALFGLIASCTLLIHQKAQLYDLHEEALGALPELELKLKDSSEALARLKSRMSCGSKPETSILESAKIFRENALAQYRDGYLRGLDERQKRYDQLPLYTRLKHQLEREGRYGQPGQQ